MPDRQTSPTSTHTDHAATPGQSASLPQRVAAALILPLLAGALYWTVRIAIVDYAFRSGIPSAIRRSIQSTPTNPEYYEGLAQQEASSAVVSLEKAAALSPASSSYRMELGLAAEQQGDMPKAEANLLEATRIDRTFGPRFVLAEFYARRHDVEKFWPVTRDALTISYGDVSTLFADCWGLSTDSRTILDRAIPDRLQVYRQYLDFLLGEKHLAAAAPIGAKLLDKADSDSTKSLLRYCDRLLEAGQGKGALGIWNKLAEQSLIPYHRIPLGQAMLPTGTAELVTNGDFGQTSLGMGFDWRFTEPGGIYIEREGKPPTIAVSFTGKQAESAEILSQYVPLALSRDYDVTVRYSTKNIGPESGLKILLLATDGTDLLGGTGLLPGNETGNEERKFRFAAQPKTDLARLVLAYQRVLGTMRIEGSLILRGFSVSLSGPATR